MAKIYNKDNPGKNSSHSIKMMEERDEPIDSKNLKGKSFQHAKGIMQKAMANRSKKSKMMEMGADYYIKNREGMY
jgi:hypothetical protein